jgi:hypothetical protein
MVSKLVYLWHKIKQEESLKTDLFLSIHRLLSVPTYLTRYLPLLATEGVSSKLNGVLEHRNTQPLGEDEE